MWDGEVSNGISNQVESNLLIKHNGTMGGLKPCKIGVDVAGVLRKGRG